MADFKKWAAKKVTTNASPKPPDPTDLEDEQDDEEDEGGNDASVGKSAASKLQKFVAARRRAK